MTKLDKRVSATLLCNRFVAKDVWASRGVRDGEHEAMKVKIV